MPQVLLVFPLAIGLLVLWKAEGIGRALRSLDGGKLGRESVGFGAGPQAYPFFIRFAAGVFTVFIGAALVRSLLA